jgi:hypothetical protein
MTHRFRLTIDFTAPSFILWDVSHHFAANTLFPLCLRDLQEVEVTRLHAVKLDGPSPERALSECEEVPLSVLGLEN